MIVMKNVHYNIVKLFKSCQSEAKVDSRCEGGAP